MAVSEAAAGGSIVRAALFAEAGKFQRATIAIAGSDRRFGNGHVLHVR